ncbi:putative Dol-P-Man:Man(7)GlcNAc(2)-PP-Dol alpha-1,6-mannosyltransferase [Cyphellophora attinorum]|uniref:Mannosyltransferase n=1 Tax=Cyphellophora attinorum TaxID=1664694 RepID=A0A0N1HIX7_9EURO|nr:putative Dol-P-Man:Man(7)GlcNAc(2)-PP-Dol alpha-1,6-mannosyltransferase [Phialophora attinorum]KPI36200.1 putative Dol-P-Man:Man(7)GlcNAc(2)-PP-Dol alpha-1,6-mannosyltransferase [Phialophora attinorum]
MRIEAWHAGVILIPTLVLLHLVVAPYNKVEESFNIQAAHDFLTYGISLDRPVARIKAFYDHVKFPGAVPRTFIGALVLAGLSNPFVALLSLDLPQQQTLVRAVLGLLTAASVVFYAFGVRKAYGKVTASWFVAFQASQFHVTFYASRTLPNTFAFVLTTFALRFTLPEPASRMSPTKRLRLAIYIMTITTIIFRSEIALLLAGHGLLALLPSTSLARAISTVRSVLLPAVLTATVAGLLLTVSIDTFMWQTSRFVWPEAAAFLSNVFPPPGSQGASAWGTSPWHWYLTSAIPRLTPTPALLLLPISAVLVPTLRQTLLPLLLPVGVYVTLYSILPHKETRFLFPIVPTLNTVLALVATHSTNRISRSRLQQLVTLSLIVSTTITFLVSHLILLPLSALTYPGGASLSLVHANAAQTPHVMRQSDVHVHLTNLALQTGVTRFLEHRAPTPHHRDHSEPRKGMMSASTPRFRYDKSTNATGLYLKAGFWARFDYIVVEEAVAADVVQIFQTVTDNMDDLSWSTVARVPGLGRPVLTNIVEARRNAPNKSRRDSLQDLFSRMYGRGSLLARLFTEVHGAARQVLAEDAWVPSSGGRSLTRGWWVEWAGTEEGALVVMQQRRRR